MMDSSLAHVPLFPDWMQGLPLQQQAVLVLALRGPDGDPKDTAFKVLLRAMRATVMRAAYYGEFLNLERMRGDTFMDLRVMAMGGWQKHVEAYLENEADAACLHQYTHFMHAAEILGYKHPDTVLRGYWHLCYVMFADRLHLNPESEEQLDEQLNDWGRRGWPIPKDQ